MPQCRDNGDGARKRTNMRSVQTRHEKQGEVGRLQLEVGTSRPFSRALQRCGSAVMCGIVAVLHTGACRRECGYGAHHSFMLRRGPDHQSTRTIQVGEDCHLHLSTSLLQLTGDEPAGAPQTDALGNVLCFNGALPLESDRPLPAPTVNLTAGGRGLTGAGLAHDREGNTTYWCSGEVYSGLARGPSENDGSVFLAALREAASASPAATTGDPNSHLEGDCTTNNRILALLLRLRGPNTFVFYHKASQALYFGRDPLGRRSLLIGCVNGAVVLASVLPDAHTGPPQDTTACEAQWKEVPPGLYVIQLVQGSRYNSLSCVPWCPSPAQCSAPRDPHPAEDTCSDSVPVPCSEESVPDSSERDSQRLVQCPCSCGFRIKCISEGDEGFLLRRAQMTQVRAPSSAHARESSGDSPAASNDAHREALTLAEERGSLDACEMVACAADPGHSSWNVVHEHVCQGSSNTLSASDWMVLQRLNCSIARRCSGLPLKRKLASTWYEHETAPASLPPARIMILFSGGLDSTLLAMLTHFNLPPGEPIDLASVCFDAGASPDRNSALDALDELASAAPDRQWRLLCVDTSLTEVDMHAERLRHLIHPTQTHMDLNISAAIWMAARGVGVLRLPAGRDMTQLHDGSGGSVQYTSQARAVLLGHGADEVFAGYSRHRTRFKQGGWDSLQDELQLDMGRLWLRNLGRDDRVVADHSREARHPFLDEDVLSLTAALPLPLLTDLSMPGGQGDKAVLRRIAAALGLQRTSVRVKRAIQFGTRLGKQMNVREYGSNRAANVAHAGSVRLSKADV